MRPPSETTASPPNSVLIRQMISTRVQDEPAPPHPTDSKLLAQTRIGRTSDSQLRRPSHPTRAGNRNTSLGLFLAGRYAVEPGSKRQPGKLQYSPQSGPSCFLVPQSIPGYNLLPPTPLFASHQPAYLDSRNRARRNLYLPVEPPRGKQTTHSCCYFFFFFSPATWIICSLFTPVCASNYCDQCA
jgi:hypothetical protein